MPESIDLAATRARAAEAARATEALRAELRDLNRRAGPARAAIRARDEAAQHLTEARQADAQRGADALVAGRKPPKADAGLADAEKALLDAQRDADAAETLMARLRQQADAVRECLTAAEAAQGEAAGALVAAEHEAALAAWDAAVEALGPVMARLDALHAAAVRLRVTLPGGTDAPALRRVLLREGLCLTRWGSVGRERPSWLLQADAESASARAVEILAQAGLAPDFFVRQRHERIGPNAAAPRGATITPGRPEAAQAPEPPRPPRRVDFGPGRPTGPVRFTPTGIQ